MDNTQKKFGLFTTISMIVGVVVGSGIFFKSDEILKGTGGNIWLGVLVFCIGAFSIIFGSLTVAELAIRSKAQDGVIGYYQEFVSSKIATGFAWFQTFIYYPALCMVIAYVGGGYLCSLFRVFLDEAGKATPEGRIILGFSVAMVLLIVNVISEKFSAYLQNATTIIKLLPLSVIAIAGLLSPGASVSVPDGVTLVECKDVGLKWIAALVPVAFSYEGWILATNMSSDVKNPKKTLPLALTIAPIVVLAAYVLYFVGISNMLGVNYIMTMKNTAVNTAGNLLFGVYGDKILLIFIIISVFGVVNGVYMSMLKMPSMLKSKQMFPKMLNKKFLSPAVLTVLLSAIWMLVQYVMMKSNVFHLGSDATSVAIVLGYAFYSILYVRVLMMKEIKNPIKRFVYPVLALLGASIILIGGTAADPLYTLGFTVFAAIVFGCGCRFAGKQIKSK